MALVESQMLPLGTVMPDFNLFDTEQNDFSLSSLMGDKGLFILFTCNHCPYAIAIWDRVISLANESLSLGIETVAINPNIHPDYPEDSPESMKQMVSDRGLEFPYLIDADQEVATAYDAQCTPDLYLLNPKAELVYHGRLDDNWQNPELVSNEDLKDAILALANGQTIDPKQVASMGCSIKWQ